MLIFSCTTTLRQECTGLESRDNGVAWSRLVYIPPWPMPANASLGYRRRWVDKRVFSCFFYLTLFI